MAKLRTNHLNSEEKTSLHELCFDYQDEFFLPGDKLSCTHATRHTIQLKPGVTPPPPLIHDPTDYPKVKRKR
jgi:hypothetical protein